VNITFMPCLVGAVTGYLITKGDWKGVLVVFGVSVGMFFLLRGFESVIRRAALGIGGDDELAR
jgi:hypothetical protein